MKMAMMYETPVIMRMVDRPVMVIDQVTMTQLVVQSMSPQALSEFAEKPEVPGQLEGYGL